MHQYITETKYQINIIIHGNVQELLLIFLAE